MVLLSRLQMLGITGPDRKYDSNLSQDYNPIAAAPPDLAICALEVLIPGCRSKCGVVAIPALTQRGPRKQCAYAWGVARLLRVGQFSYKSPFSAPS